MRDWCDESVTSSSCDRSAVQVVQDVMQQVWPVAADGLVQEFTRLQEMHDTCDRALRRSENLWVCVVFMSVLDAGTGLPSANVMVRCLGAVG